ncbi:MAG: hypothetical protein V4438_03150 [Patescibacteria group bacterium]
MQHTKGKNHILLIISFIILLVSGFAYGIMFFSFDHLRADLDDLYQTSANHKDRLSQLRNIESNLKSTLDEKDRLASLFIKQESIVSFISEIESAMKSLGLKGEIETVAENTPDELAGTDKEILNISLVANGSWSGVAKLAGEIEALPYKSTLDNLSLSFGDAGKAGDVKKWKISLKMHALVQKKADTDPNTNPNE